MRASNGLIRQDEYQRMKIAVQRAEMDLKNSQLNLEEVRATGEVPRNELYAPKVRDRDFVSERLKIEKKEMDLDLEQMKIQLKRIQQLVEENLVSKHELDRIQADIANREMMRDKIQERLDLRKSFLSKEMSAQEIEVKTRLIEAERNLKLAQTEVDSLKKHLSHIKELVAQGKISQTEVKRLQYDLDAAQAELKLAVLEKEVLEKIK